jgi:hypothetical protein
VLALSDGLRQIAVDREQIMFAPFLGVPAVFIPPEDDVIGLAVDGVFVVYHFYAWVGN